MKQNKKIIAALSTILLGLIFVLQANADTVKRSNFIVTNLSCTSCLANIEAELKSVPGTLGMDADLRSGRVTVDHLDSVDYEQIAARISKLGYPATVDWTANVPEQYTRRFAPQSRYNSGCSSGGCGSGVTGDGLTAWRTAPTTGLISRTTLQASNLSCTSCLNNIAAELRQMPDTYGMKGYLSRGVIIVDHISTLDNKKIAEAISNLGYPARIVALNDVPAQKAFSASGRDVSQQNTNPVRAGSGCNSRGPCNATAGSWQKLYNRYFSQTNPQ
jgi:copper chaperone CopZ